MSGDWLDDDQLSILVIDDEPNVVRLIAETLLRENHQVVSAESAEQGLEQLPYYAFHVAFIDHNLPEMPGLVLAGYLREHNPDMQVALVTGSTEPRLREQVEALGLTLIRKPFDIRELFQVVDSYRQGAVERHRRQKAETDAHFVPVLSQLDAAIDARLQLPALPDRIASSLAKQIKECLNRLRSSARYHEADRVAAYAGLVAARVFGVELPKTRRGGTLWARYDALMVQHGRRAEFGPVIEPAPEDD